MQLGSMTTTIREGKSQRLGNLSIDDRYCWFVPTDQVARDINLLDSTGNLTVTGQRSFLTLKTPRLALHAENQAVEVAPVPAQRYLDSNERYLLALKRVRPMDEAAANVKVDVVQELESALQRTKQKYQKQATVQVRTLDLRNQTPPTRSYNSAVEISNPGIRLKLVNKRGGCFGRAELRQLQIWHFCS